MIEDYAKTVKPEDRDAAIIEARRREADQREMRLRLEALQSGEVLPECKHCGSEFTGRSDARFCSTQCRVAAHRARVKAEGQLTEAEKQAKEDAEFKDDAMRWLDGFYEKTKDVAGTVGHLKFTPKGRRKVIGWMRDAIADIEALD